VTRPSGAVGASWLDGREEREDLESTVVATVREFVDRDVRPAARSPEHRDEYPEKSSRPWRSPASSGWQYPTEAPLMIIGEGANEIHRNVIVGQMIQRGGL
jgi:hypothetical protein